MAYRLIDLSAGFRAGARSRARALRPLGRWQHCFALTLAVGLPARPRAVAMALALSVHYDSHARSARSPAAASF